MAVLVALPLAALAQAPAAQTPTAPKAAAPKPVAQTDAVELTATIVAIDDTAPGHARGRGTVTRRRSPSGHLPLPGSRVEQSRMAGASWVDLAPGGDRGRVKRDKMERALRRFRTTT
jgi:hypothetical protein